MRIEIDTDKLPEGMTEKQVFDAIEGSLMVYIGSFTGAPDHEEGCKTAALVWKSLVKPCEPVPVDVAKTLLDLLNSKDLTYLRLVSDTRNGHNDHIRGWRNAVTQREKLKKLKLVTVKSYKAAHMGDVDITYCEITKKGREVLTRSKRQR